MSPFIITVRSDSSSDPKIIHARHLVSCRVTQEQGVPSTAQVQLYNAQESPFQQGDTLIITKVGESTPVFEGRIHQSEHDLAVHTAHAEAMATPEDQAAQDEVIQQHPAYDPLIDSETVRHTIAQAPPPAPKSPLVNLRRNYLLGGATMQPSSLKPEESLQVRAKLSARFNQYYQVDLMPLVQRAAGEGGLTTFTPTHTIRRLQAAATQAFGTKGALLSQDLFSRPLPQAHPPTLSGRTARQLIPYEIAGSLRYWLRQPIHFSQQWCVDYGAGTGPAHVLKLRVHAPNDQETVPHQVLKRPFNQTERGRQLLQAIQCYGELVWQSKRATTYSLQVPLSHYPWGLKLGAWVQFQAPDKREVQAYVHRIVLEVDAKKQVATLTLKAPPPAGAYAYTHPEVETTQAKHAYFHPQSLVKHTKVAHRHGDQWAKQHQGRVPVTTVRFSPKALIPMQVAHRYTITAAEVA